jgi:hypothetical protein
MSQADASRNTLAFAALLLGAAAIFREACPARCRFLQLLISKTHHHQYSIHLIVDGSPRK